MEGLLDEQQNLPLSPQKPCEKPITVAWTLGGVRVMPSLFGDCLTSERDPVTKQNGGTGSGQVKPILYVSYDMVDTQNFQWLSYRHVT